MTFIEACRAWLQVHGRLPFRLTLMLEGDEEGDNQHLDRFLRQNRREFSADTAWICDTDLWGERTPAITTRLRGCLGEEVVVTGPAVDLHSGYYGGAVVNPLHVLSSIMAALHDRRGRVQIPHFYDGVKPLPAAVKKQWAGLKFNARKFLADAGVSVAAGEQGYSVLEQIWSRPTAECNGLLGGYSGGGSKTVLPAKAMAKFSFRLVAGQEPASIRRHFRAFVRQRLPKDCKVTFSSSGGDSNGISVAEDSIWLRAAKRGLKSEWGREAVLVGCGGSIPVVESFKRHLKIDSLLVGFAKESDNVHSPNEKYDLECFRRGIRSWVRIIAETARQETA
jgi:acetylornithine deacetylase/succinyl-diaminopimelate desuccinylase-like protein